MRVITSEATLADLAVAVCRRWRRRIFVFSFDWD